MKLMKKTKIKKSRYIPKPELEKQKAIDNYIKMLGEKKIKKPG